MISPRLQRMCDRVHREDIYAPAVKTEYDPYDLFLPDPVMNAKRINDYLQNQPVELVEDDRFVGGKFRFDGSIATNLFPRTGHTGFQQVCSAFYNKPQENLCTFEWQHSTANFDYVIHYGMEGYLKKIADAREKYPKDREKREFLDAVELSCHAIINWAQKCAAVCREQAKKAEPARAAELLKMADIVEWVPQHPARSFREAVQAVYICFEFLSDSLGTVDRYLYDLYCADLSSGVLTRQAAKEYLQELFVLVQGFTRFNDSRHTRGGESHFAIGGYTADGKDGFTDLSRLIVEALMELPLYCPQISFRWTEKTPHETLRMILDYERKDPFKRIAVVNDEPRIRAFQDHLGLTFAEAVNYTMVGCNEPSLQGSIWMGGCTTNGARSLERTLYDCTQEICACTDFEDFYARYERELQKDLERIRWFSDSFNYARARDNNVLSTIFIDGCIENATSVTRGGASHAVTGFNMMGLTCVIDSLAVIHQFVFDEKVFTMQELIEMLRANWVGFEDERLMILRRGRFFGNNDPLSDALAARVTTSIYETIKDWRNIFGHKFLVGCLAGYNPHYVWFGNRTRATPDGRFDGDAFMVGAGQAGGRDREGLTALLNSVAKMDPHHILSGPFVCNIMLDEVLIRKDENFEKTVQVLEAYFRSGGIHVQLNYVSREELLAAREEPEKYRNLRVRVSGFSEYFNRLYPEMQEEIVNRTTQKA